MNKASAAAEDSRKTRKSARSAEQQPTPAPLNPQTLSLEALREKLEAPPYEKAVQELEDIVSALEGGETPLEKAAELYERGVLLSAYCSKTLESLEEKIKILQPDEDGSLAERDFAPSEDEA